MREGQRERETQNRKQAPDSELSAQSPTRGSNPRTARWRPELNRTLNRLSPPGAPLLSVSNTMTAGVESGSNILSVNGGKVRRVGTGPHCRAFLGFLQAIYSAQGEHHRPGELTPKIMCWRCWAGSLARIHKWPYFWDILPIK